MLPWDFKSSIEGSGEKNVCGPGKHCSLAFITSTLCDEGSWMVNKIINWRQKNPILSQVKQKKFCKSADSSCLLIPECLKLKSIKQEFWPCAHFADVFWNFENSVQIATKNHSNLSLKKKIWIAKLHSFAYVSIRSFSPGTIFLVANCNVSRLQWEVWFILWDDTFLKRDLSYYITEKGGWTWGTFQ